MTALSTQLGLSQLGLAQLGMASNKGVPGAPIVRAQISQTDVQIIILPDVYQMMNFKPED